MLPSSTNEKKNTVTHELFSYGIFRGGGVGGGGA